MIVFSSKMYSPGVGKCTELNPVLESEPQKWVGFSSLCRILIYWYSMFHFVPGVQKASSPAPNLAFCGFCFKNDVDVTVPVSWDNKNYKRYAFAGSWRSVYGPANSHGVWSVFPRI
jgi:hypothetical protein